VSRKPYQTLIGKYVKATNGAVVFLFGIKNMPLLKMTHFISKNLKKYKILQNKNLLYTKYSD